METIKSNTKSHKKTIKKGTEKKELKKKHHLSKEKTKKKRKARKIILKLRETLENEDKKLTSKSPSKKEVKEKSPTTSKKLMSEEKTSASHSTSKTSQSSKKRLNDDLIQILNEMIDILTKQGEHFRAGRYKVAQETIMSLSEDVTDVSQLEGKKGIGPTILKKLQEFQKTGKIEFIEREKKNPALLLTNVYGIGYKGAKKLVDEGITTIAKLKQEQDEVLNDTQKKGLKYYDDIMKRIPRSEIEDYEEILQEAFDEVKNPGSRFEIVGSYRRGNKDSGDIDVIITDENNDRKVFGNFLDALLKRKVLLEMLSRGKVKSLTIGKLPGKPARRLDFLYSTPDEYAFSVLYFTGSKTFNTFMRRRALEFGYSMNEHGLYRMSSGKKGDKIDMKFPDEKSIFDFLNMEYKKPEERIDGNSVVESITATQKSPQQPDDSGTFKVSPEAIEQTDAAPLSTTALTETIPIEEASKSIVIKVKKSKKKKAKTIKKPPTTTAKQNLKTFQKQGETFLQSLTEKELENMVQTATKAYYNEKPLITDNQFDIVKEFTEREYPTNKVITQVGAPIEKNKVTLPYFMGSMDKIKPDTKALSRWMDKFSGPYVLSGKLDGISALYTTDEAEPHLYTRGNGRVGQDITYMIPYLKLPDEEGLVIRGELIVSKEVFQTKYADSKANARNLVAGIVNAKKVDESAYNDVSFVAYELIKPEMKPSEQFSTLESYNVETVRNQSEETLTNDMLSKTLVDWRESYEYETDGVIVTDDNIYEREEKNPAHSFAFKMVLSDQIAEAKVVDVLWTPSKHGHLKPRIKIEPINIGGARIEYATAFNAKFVEENNLGIGSVIKLVRSGDVIPHIMEVIEQADEPKMPDVDYEWDETHVNIKLKGASGNRTVREKIIGAFFKKMDVAGIGPGIVSRLYEAGFDTIPGILAMRKDDFLEVEGIKDKMATKLHNNIKNHIYDKADIKTLAKIMAGSNIFERGIGEKKIIALFKVYPDILTSDESYDEKVDMITDNVEGFAGKSAEQFVKNIPEFLEFMKEAKLENKLSDYTSPKAEKMKSTTKSLSSPLFEKSVVLTGFRNKDLETILEEKHGAKVSGSVSKKTFTVIVPDLDTDTGKAEKARELNVPLMTEKQFTEKYL